MKKVSKRREFGVSRGQTLVPSKWFLDDVEVTEMEFYGITPETTLEEVMAQEPADYSKFGEWKIKVSLIKERDGDPSNPLHGIIGF